MDDVSFQELFGLTEKDKTDLISRLSQDITWDDDLIIEQGDLIDSEQDVHNTEEEN